ncbi:MAG TPA: hypothetical protein VFB46_04070 [Gemmatimonadaceae bacterium]|nr:hypothetical protein [Gemmatimonadaceae bacterium]
MQRSRATRPDDRSHDGIVSRGRSFPLGVTVVEGGVNFCIFSGDASAIELGTIVDPSPLDEQGPRTDASTP